MANHYLNLTRDATIMTEEHDHPKMPYIVNVIDEFAYLKLSAKDKGMETMVIRLSQEARAGGIHMIGQYKAGCESVFSPTNKANLVQVQRGCLNFSFCCETVK
jgi:hypothetical protein